MDMNYYRRRNALMPQLQQQQDDQDGMSFPLMSSNDDTPDESDTPDEISSVDTLDDPTPDETTAPATMSSNFTDMYNAANAAPTGPNNTRYGKFLEAGVPNRNDYKPGKLNRLAAILGGASAGYQGGAARGVNVAKGILDDNYNEALSANEMQGKRLAAGASLEDKEMGRKASFARTATNVNIADEKNKTAKLNADSLAMLRRAQAHKAMNPSAVYKNINGKVVAIGGDGKQTILGDANLLSGDAFKQRKDLAEFSSNLIAGREVKLAGINDKNADDRQNNLFKHDETMEDIKTRHAKEMDDYRKAHPDQPTTTTTEATIDDTGKKRTTTSTTSKGGNKSAGTIKVIRKSDGLSGTIPAANFDPAKYDKVQ